jgi:predicted Zn finger-like uncharacterized protein
MKLVCPSCESGFLVDASAIGPTGRNVRCGRCGNSWLAMPVEVIPDDPSAASEGLRDDILGQPADTPDQSDVPQPKLAEFEHSRRRSRAAPGITGAEPGRRGSLGGWLLFSLAAAALLAGAVLGRQQIMAWAPESSTLYALVGLAEEPPLPALPQIPLRFQEVVTSDRQQVDGTPELVIEGEIFNPTDQPQDVPPLVATLMDPTGIELKRWVFAAETEVLPPGGRVAFQTSTQNPPGQGNLNLYFVPQRH